MATIQELKELARHAAHGTAPAEFSAANVDEAFRGELQKFCGSINQFMKNRYDLYEIIIENADEIVPNKVLSALGAFAEIKTVGQNERAIFMTPLKGKNRGKRFITQVGLSGVYETFRLDRGTIEVFPKAQGGAVTIDFERMLDGYESLSDVMEVLTEGLEESVYNEVQKALKKALTVSGRPAANTVALNYFDATQMFKLCSVAKAYGTGAVIFAPPEFVGAMGPDAVVAPITGAAQGIYHPSDIDDIHNTGYVTSFRGTPIVQIPQSFTDETNSTTVIDPQMAYIFPTGKEKIVKVVFEGQTQIYDRENRDNSMEVDLYRKLGVAIMSYHNWCEYQNTSL